MMTYNYDDDNLDIAVQILGNIITNVTFLQL